MVTFFEEVTCGTCGQEARIVRQSLHYLLPRRAPEGRATGQCMECTLRPLTQTERNYYIVLWRLLWRRAGGKDADMPRVLRPDGARFLPAPRRVVPAAQPAGPADGLGSNTPRAASHAKRTEIPFRSPSQPLRVLFATHDLSRTGAPIFLSRMVRALRGIDATVYSPQAGPLGKEFLDAGIPVLHNLPRIVPDLVVANTLLSTPVVLWARDNDIPCVWLIHEYTPDLCGNAREVSAVIDYPRTVIFPHQATAANFHHLRSERIAIVPTVVPPRPIMDRATAREVLGLEPNAFIVVTFGSDEARKGQADLRQATVGLNMDVHCVYGAPDPDTWLAAADVYVCCSRVECMPLSVQEAKGHGLPVVTTTIPGCREIVREGIDGLWYQPGDIDRLRRHLWRLKEDYERRITLAGPADHLPRFDETLQRYERIFAAAAGRGVDAPLHVVYHVASMGKLWKDIVAEQLNALRAAGLTYILCTHVGEGLDWLCEHAGSLGVKLIVCDHRERLDHYERPAIELIERLVRSSDLPVLYLHSKGVSHEHPGEMYHDWRRLMQGALLPHWREHVAALAEYDAVGVNWWSAPTLQHFSGNFWLARASWLRQLPSLATIYKDRYSCERWIGCIDGCKAKSLLCQDAAFWDRDRQLFQTLLAEQKQRG